MAEEGGLPERAAFLLSPRVVVLSSLCSLLWPKQVWGSWEPRWGRSQLGGRAAQCSAASLFAGWGHKDVVSSR